MARVTVEDCRKIVNNRYELVLLAGVRTNALKNGVPALIDADSTEKPTVIALREIAQSKLDTEMLKNEMIKKFQKKIIIEPMINKNLHVEPMVENTDNLIKGRSDENNQY